VRNFGEFVLLVSVLVAIPGPAVTLIFKNAVASGARSALVASAGVFAADLVWVAASVVGITAVVVSSEVAFEALRLVGAAYLVYLGIRLLLNRGIEDDAAPRAPVTRSLRRSFVEGVLCDLSNPKTALVFTSVIPQFLTTSASAADVAVLGVLFAVLGLLSLLMWVALGVASRRVIAISRVRVVIMRVSGAVLVAFGARLALER
jgi:threonine/homoserine/homoserine lactone efflux protein